MFDMDGFVLDRRLYQGPILLIAMGVCCGGPNAPQHMVLRALFWTSCNAFDDALLNLMAIPSSTSILLHYRANTCSAPPRNRPHHIPGTTAFPAPLRRGPTVYPAPPCINSYYE